MFVVGTCAAVAIDDVYWFEKSCQLQVELKMLGSDPKKCAMSDEAAKFTYEQAYAGKVSEKRWYAENLFNAWR